VCGTTASGRVRGIVGARTGYGGESNRRGGGKGMRGTAAVAGVGGVVGAGAGCGVFGRRWRRGGGKGVRWTVAVAGVWGVVGTGAGCGVFGRRWRRCGRGRRGMHRTIATYRTGAELRTAACDSGGRG
jgi:hypothetical protein